MKIAAVVLILTMGLSTVSAYGAAVTKPTISARSAVVMDADNGKIVYSKMLITRGILSAPRNC